MERYVSEIDISGVLAALARGERVLLVVRHAERPKIDNEDKSFGGELPLTPAGERMSEEYGRMLAGAADDVQFLASPLRRTVLTARFIAHGMGIPDASIPTDARIGNSSAFIEDELKVWNLFRDGRFFEKMGVYLETGEQYGFAPLEAAAESFERHCLSRFTARLGIFTSHDVYVAAYAKAMKLVPHLDKGNWPRFLDAVAMFARRDGSVGRAFVRAGLTDGICGV